MLSNKSASDTAFAHREARFEVHAIVSWSAESAVNARRAKQFVSEFSIAMDRYRIGAYMNTDNTLEYIHIREMESQRRLIFGSNYARLQEVCTMYVFVPCTCLFLSSSLLLFLCFATSHISIIMSLCRLRPNTTLQIYLGQLSVLHQTLYTDVCGRKILVLYVLVMAVIRNHKRIKIWVKKYLLF